MSDKSQAAELVSSNGKAATLGTHFMAGFAWLGRLEGPESV